MTIDEVLSKCSMMGRKSKKFEDLRNKNKATIGTLKLLSPSNLSGKFALYCKIFRQFSKHLLIYEYLDSEA